MKSIKTKIIFALCVLLLFVCAGLGIMSYVVAANSLTSSASDQLENMAKQGASVVKKSLDEQWTSLEVLAENDVISDVNSTWEERQAVLQKEIARTGAVNITFADANGNTKTPDGADMSVSDRAYFQKSCKW